MKAKPVRNRRILAWGIASLLFAGTPSSGRADKIASDKELMAEGEAELMDKHAVDPASMRYKPGKGLEVTSEDGKFSLVTRVRGQALAAVENEPKAPAEMGLMLRRARVVFEGHTFGEHNTFKIELAVSPRDLNITRIDSNTFPRETPLLDFYMEFDQLRDLTMRVGQYKIPYSRQRVISSGDLEMVDRSIANGEFNLDRDIGIDLRSKDLFGLGLFRYYVGVYNGEGRSAFSNGNSDLMYLGRLEFLPLGMFKDYSEGDFERLSKPGLSIGLAYAFAGDAGATRVNQGPAPSDGGTSDCHNLAADVTFKYQGLSLSSEFFLRKSSRHPGSAVDENGIPLPVQDPREGYGWFAQAGYLVPRSRLGLSGRFGQNRATGDSSLRDLDEAGLALSYYFAEHPFKLQTDAFQVWEGDFADGATVVRTQLQLAF